MVAFGKKLKENQIQEWKGYYIDYKFLKKKVNRYSQQLDVGTQDPSFVLWDFSKMLDDQIQKVVLFLLEEQGLLAHRLLSLGEQCSDLLQQGERASICKIEQGYRQVGQDLLRLVFFLEMNATGLRKILKKFDKRFGYRFTDYYVKTRANHPYSQLQQVFKQVGVGAVAGSISRNLAELRDHQGIYVSIYDQPILSNTDPLVDSINAAVNRLSNSTDFLEFLGRHAFIISGDSGQLEDYAAEEEFHFMSLLLNLVNAFLYMINTYIIVPTADSYSLNLGAAATVCGVVIGSMAVAQLFSSIYFSAWSNRSYLRPLVFSSTVLLIGNTLYALAYDINSITVLLVGRLFCGLGSARAISRRYISDCVPLKFRMKASAAFVSASALGMACGPALACLFQTNFKIFNLTFNEDTLPGWFMALAWLFYLLWLWMSFKEPVREIKEGVVPQEGPSAKYTFKKNLEAPLLLQAEAKQEMSNEDEDCEEDSEEDHEPVTSLVSAYRILSPSVKVQLFVYFMLKYAMEILLAECSVVSTYYFEWPTKTVAVFLGFLGLTVLPVNVIVGHFRQVVVASEIMLCIGILFSFNVFVPYTVIQYIGSAFVTFV